MTTGAPAAASPRPSTMRAPPRPPGPRPTRSPTARAWAALIVAATAIRVPSPRHAARIAPVRPMRASRSAPGAMVSSALSGR